MAIFRGLKVTILRVKSLKSGDCKGSHKWRLYEVLKVALL